MMYYILLLDERIPKISLNEDFWVAARRVAQSLNNLFIHERHDE